MKTIVLGLAIMGLFGLGMWKVNGLAEACADAGPAECQVAP